MSYVSKSSHNVFNALSRREYGKPTALKSYLGYRVEKNLVSKNHTKTIFSGHQQRIHAVDIKGAFAASMSFDYTIKLWNCETGQCLWTFRANPVVRWSEMLKIVDGRIVCSGLAETSVEHKLDNTIRLLDLKTGNEEATITHPQLCYEEVCAVGNRIFGLLNTGKISEWDLHGNQIQLIDSEILVGSFPKFFGEGNFLVYACDDKILIHNLTTNDKQKIVFEPKSVEYFDKTSITQVRLDGSRLFCGLRTHQVRTLTDCVVIDLETCTMIHSYQATGAFLHTERDRDRTLYTTEAGYVSSFVVDNEKMYVGHNSGKIVAIDLAEKSHIVLGQHNHAIFYMSIEGGILVTGSSGLFNSGAELKFWNVKSLSKLAEMELPDLCRVSLIGGKVLAATGSSLVQWDYLVGHEGEKLITQSSPSEFVAASDPCVIQ